MEKHLFGSPDDRMGDMWEEVIATFGEEKEVSSINEGAPARAVDDPVIVIILDEDIKKMKNDELKKSSKIEGFC